MNIAIVGSGVSGLVAAYLLQREHRIELFEQDRRAGGHANTVIVPTAEGDLPLDVGFVTYNERTYPGFSRLLRELQIETQPSDMSFGVRREADGFEFSSRGLRGYLAQRRNALNPVHVRMLIDVARFQRDARRVLKHNASHDVSFADYLASRSFGRAFRERLIVPLIAATWSNARADVLGFPANYLFRFLEQHGVLSANSIPEWRWLRGGSRAYVQSILSSLAEGVLHLGEPVVRVARDLEGVSLTTAGGYERRFDAVVLACHPDEARSLLADASQAERVALDGFRYVPNRVVLHTDERLLPRRDWARAAWNFQLADSDARDALTMTYDLNRLQSLDGPTRYCVSINPGDSVDPSRVIAAFDYAHPLYTMQTLEAQRRLQALNGDRHTYFAGAYQGYGFHEDGVQSAVRVAAQLGVCW